MPMQSVTYTFIRLFFFFLACQHATAQVPRDFSFLTGSCAYIGPGDGDTSFFLYRGDTNIYYSMSKKPADFMLWLGDNWYLGHEECTTVEGLRNKARYARNVKTVQPLLGRKLPEYAIWDDHDFGPNQSQQDFPLKYESRNIFMETWKDNPYFGEKGEGIYTSFKHEDVLFILLDDRWWRDYDRLWDYKFFKPNPNKRMFGIQQMAWLKKQLLDDTTASFKIIVNGSQVLNPLAKGDCLIHFPVEYEELLGFINEHKIEGVLFISGDRHYSEIIKLDRENGYPLYDLTISPLSSTPETPPGREKRNKYRVPGSLITTHNFARVSLSGIKTDRKLTVDFFDKYGKPVYNWEVNARDLNNRE